MIKKLSQYSYYIIGSGLSLALNPIKAFAIDKDDLKTINIPVIVTDQSGANVLTSVAARVINLILLIAGILAVIYLIWSGLIYITAGGDTAKADKGRTGIVNAVIGLVIIAAAYIIVRFVAGALYAGQDATGSEVQF